MADKPKPFLKKGTGKYTKIEYPVLRRSGVFQPQPDTSSPRRLQQLQHSQQQPRTPPGREERRQQSPPLQYTSSPIARPAPSISIPPLSNRPMETGVMGQRSPSMSDYSRTSDSPPRTTAFGSSLERRMGESDEGMGRELRSNSPPPNSGRPGTVDSGFPREDVPLSPASSNGETRASSFPSMDEDITRVNTRDHHSEDDILRPLHYPPLSPSTPSAAAVDEDEVFIEPATSAIAAPAARPIPARRSSLADRSAIGTSTAEFERREQQALRREEMEKRNTRLSHSSLNSSASTVANDLNREARKLIKEMGEDHGEELFPRYRHPLPTSNATRATTKEILGRVPRLNGPQKMIGSRLDSTVDPDASTLSPIDSNGRPASVQEFDGASFHGSAGSRPDSTSHFRMRSTFDEESAAAETRGRRDGDMQHRSTQHPSLQMQPNRRRRSEEEGSEASSGSTAVARRYLMGDRRALADVGRRRSNDEITRTQQRPRHHIRASEATLTRPPVIIQEEFSDGRSDDEGEMTFDVERRGTRVEERRGEGERRGETREEKRRRDVEWREREVEKREERVRLMESQLRDVIAHADMGNGAHRSMKEKLQRTFDQVLLKLAAEYAAKEETMREEARKKEEEWNTKVEGCEKMRTGLEKERLLVRKDETAKVKEWRTKFEEEQKKYIEEKKKNGTEISRRRIVEEKAKKEREEAAKNMEKLQTSYDRMKKVMESSQREQAASRGSSAHRLALSRAEDEAAAAPRRNGLQRTRFGGSTSALNDKENCHPSIPPGILKKNQVRFADTTFTVQPEDAHSFFEASRGQCEWGPCVIYANRIGKRVRLTTPACGCFIFHYSNGDMRHIPADRSVTFHYLAESGAMQFDFIKERCQVRYYPDGTLEILRTGKEVTWCSPTGESVETIKRTDGSMYAEIWRGNAMALYDGRMGEFREQYSMGRKVTKRYSWVGESCVALHSNKDIEFIEPHFHAIYYASSNNVQFVVNNKRPNETRYTLQPGEIGEVRHGLASPLCVEFGLYHRWSGR